MRGAHSAGEMAIKAIVHDYAEIMVPTDEARPRAIKKLDELNNKAIEVEFRMGQALIALEELGYSIVKNDKDGK